MAEDVTQEALVRAARSTDKLKAIEEPRAWLRTVVVRCAMTALGRARRELHLNEPPAGDPTESMAVRFTLERLKPADRALLALAHFEELTYEQIAESLGIPIGTVASRLHASREVFRKEWTK